MIKELHAYNELKEMPKYEQIIKFNNVEIKKIEKALRGYKSEHLMKMMNDYKNENEMMLKKRAEIFQRISKLKYIHAKILNLRYVAGLSWGKIEQITHYSRAALYRYNYSALQEYERVLSHDEKI